MSTLKKIVAAPAGSYIGACPHECIGEIVSFCFEREALSFSSASKRFLALAVPFRLMFLLFKETPAQYLSGTGGKPGFLAWRMSSAPLPTVATQHRDPFSAVGTNTVSEAILSKETVRQEKAQFEAHLNTLAPESELWPNLITFHEAAVARWIMSHMSHLGLPRILNMVSANLERFSPQSILALATAVARSFAPYALEHLHLEQLPEAWFGANSDAFMALATAVARSFTPYALEHLHLERRSEAWFEANSGAFMALATAVARSLTPYALEHLHLERLPEAWFEANGGAFMALATGIVLNHEQPQGPAANATGSVSRSLRVASNVRMAIESQNFSVSLFNVKYMNSVRLPGEVVTSTYRPPRDGEKQPPSNCCSTPKVKEYWLITNPTAEDLRSAHKVWTINRHAATIVSHFFCKNRFEGVLSRKSKGVGYMGINLLPVDQSS